MHFFLIKTDSAPSIQKKNGPGVTQSARPKQTRRVQSKILGDFVPKDTPQTTTVNDSSGTIDKGSDDGTKIVELFVRATDANSARKTQRF